MIALQSRRRTRDDASAEDTNDGIMDMRSVSPRREAPALPLASGVAKASPNPAARKKPALSVQSGGAGGRDAQWECFIKEALAQSPYMRSMVQMWLQDEHLVRRASCSAFLSCVTVYCESGGSCAD